VLVTCRLCMIKCKLGLKRGGVTMINIKLLFENLNLTSFISIYTVL